MKFLMRFWWHWSVWMLFYWVLALIIDCSFTHMGVDGLVSPRFHFIFSIVTCAVASLIISLAKSEIQTEDMHQQ